MPAWLYLTIMISAMLIGTVSGLVCSHKYKKEINNSNENIVKDNTYDNK